MATKTAAKKSTSPKKKRTCNKARNPRQPQPAANLPEPIDVAAARVQQSEPTPEKKGGLLDDLGSLFSGADNPGASPLPSPVSSTGFSTEPLSPESERLLSSLPSSIGGEPDDSGVPADVPTQDPIAALMAQVAFEPQDVQDVIEELFDWLSVRLESDHWKLTERQSRMLGRPAAQLLNSMWLKLQNYIPDILSKWCEDTPGATAFILACGIVVAPKIARQVAIRKERASMRPLVQDKPQPVPPQPIWTEQKQRVGIVVETGGN
jgi:hypothetical protein